MIWKLLLTLAVLIGGWFFIPLDSREVRLADVERMILLRAGPGF